MKAPSLVEKNVRQDYILRKTAQLEEIGAIMGYILENIGNPPVRTWIMREWQCRGCDDADISP